MNYALYVIAGMEAAGTLVSVSRVGKPRKPLAGPDAAFLVVIDAMVIVALILAAMRLGPS